ncbi:hypothetical protein Tco_1564119 [Tanacetum coccineum]
MLQLDLTTLQAILVDEVGNPLKNIEYPGDYDSEDEVASVDNDMVRSMASEWVGFGTQSLLEQWRDSYGNGDYDEDPYDDDMYEGQDLPQELQALGSDCGKRKFRTRDDSDVFERYSQLCARNVRPRSVGNLPRAANVNLGNLPRVAYVNLSVVLTQGQIRTLKWDYQHMCQKALNEHGAELQHVEVLLLVIHVVD